MKVHGLLLLDKPLGLSSNAALQKVKRLLGADKAGHAGTLDPMASGVLPLMFGEACKLAGAALKHDKAYEAEVRFGMATTTDDVEGEVISLSDRRPTLDELQAALPRFQGNILQVPPVYSALKVGGKAMYRHAREGAPVQARPREARVDDIALLAFDGERARLAIDCGSGTYIRSIARDLGEVLGCGAHLSALRRTRVGIHRVADAVSLQTLLDGGPEVAHRHLHGLLDLVKGWPSVTLDDDGAKRFAQGQGVIEPGWQASTGLDEPLSGVAQSLSPATPVPMVAPAAASAGGSSAGLDADEPEGRIAVLHQGRLVGLGRCIRQAAGRKADTAASRSGATAAHRVLMPVRVIVS